MKTRDNEEKKKRIFFKVAKWLSALISQQPDPRMEAGSRKEHLRGRNTSRPP